MARPIWGERDVVATYHGVGDGCLRRAEASLTGAGGPREQLMEGTAMNARFPRASGFVLGGRRVIDVSAINGLYVALGSPKLPGWSASGGDPCGESWQGVTFTGSSITSIISNAANLGGQLGSLGNFTSITEINLSNNNIGGSIPEDLPVTLQNIFLSDNQLTGSIPVSLSKLHSLTAMSLNDNHLDGKLPDTFDSLTELVNLHMQDNQLSGTLDVLQDLSLKDLNVENNMFSGPVPPKLLNIPNFK
ncbi:Protein STRUBBELIG-RECEPTOR FAMILY 1 [Zea mays]|uniref:Protein STRUBBELIG-RECEPTOR FAMILY 1 n=1 Tax=Zea mays TaxID=4577 RepID=A0A1D6MDJ6_MAIZE|nr:Protein STRUBBELIG-RECEPTOR FAMILY 1 [Zea mays]